MQEAFLGFLSPDAERALRLVSLLAAEGVSVFWEENPRWEGSMRRNIRHSFSRYKVAIIIWSKASAPDLGSMRHLAADARDEGKLMLVVFHKSGPDLSVVTRRSKALVWQSLGFEAGSSPIYNLALWRGSRNNAEFQRLVTDLKGRLCSE